MNYLYEVKVVDKDGDERKNYDVIAADLESAIFKVNHLIETDEEFQSSEYSPFRITEIKEERVIDSL